MLEQLKPDSKTIVSDLVAGLTVSMVNLAELMGYALVAGVSSIYGLYSGIVSHFACLAGARHVLTVEQGLVVSKGEQKT